MSDPERHRLRSVRIDCLFLAGLVGLSCSPYITGLGFYSDDWAFLANFSLFSRNVILAVVLFLVNLTTLRCFAPARYYTWQFCTSCLVLSRWVIML
jgi:hypothetical protein